MSSALRLGVLGVAILLAGCGRVGRPAAEVRAGGAVPAVSAEGPVGAHELLVAWLGCAAGAPWAGALESPPALEAARSLERCRAVAPVVGAQADDLAAFAPAAVTAVRKAVAERAANAAMAGPDCERLLELFDRATAALREMADALAAASEIERDARAARDAFVRLSQRTELSALLRYARERSRGPERREALALAWLVGLARIDRARGLRAGPRIAAVQPVVETLFRIGSRPRESLDDADTDAERAWDRWVRFAAEAVRPGRWLALPDDLAEVHVAKAIEQRAYVAIVREASGRLEEVGLALGRSELRRAVLGCSKAFDRDVASRELPAAIH